MKPAPPVMSTRLPANVCPSDPAMRANVDWPPAERHSENGRRAEWPGGKILEAPRRSVKPGLRPSPRSALLSLPASSPIFLMKVPYFDLPAQIRALRPELDAAIAAHARRLLVLPGA